MKGESPVAAGLVARERRLSMSDTSIVQPDHTVNGHLENGEAPKARVFTVHTRPRKATNAESMPHTGATALEALDAALTYDGYGIDDQPLVYWNKRYPLACADVDFHGPQKIDSWSLFAAFNYVYPQPLRLWRSHGGGVKAVFIDADRMTAEEAAGLYCYGLRHGGYASGCTGMEVKWETFLPWYRRGELTCGEIQAQDFAFADPGDSDALRELTSSLPTEGANEEAGEQWREENNRNLGQRFPHTECPIDPCEGSHNDPVVVYEDGVFCFRCGRLTPYTALIKGVVRKRSLVRQAAWSWVPWDQAQHYLRHEGVPDKIAPLVYRAAIKWLHCKAKDDEATRATHEHKLKMVFNRQGSSAGLVLVEGNQWVNANDMKEPVGAKLEKRINALPQLCYFKPKTKNTPAKFVADKDGAESAKLFEGKAIENLGWYTLTRLFGVHMWAPRELEADERILVVVPGDPPFKPQHKGWTLARAENHFREQFPGINLDYLRLALFAKGFTQRDFTEPPRVYATGQSGSGKTHTWLLAAEIGMCGALEIKLGNNAEWFAQSVVTAASGSDMAYIDEVMKGSQEQRKMLIGYVLSLHKGMAYHKMQAGGAHQPALPAILLADIDVDTDYGADVQTARRTVRVHLGAGAVGKNWIESCGGSIVGWRKRGLFGENAKAADVFLADVIERLRSFDDTTFETAAKKNLKFNRLSEPTADHDPDADLRALYAAWDAAEKHKPEKEDTNFRGPGWVVLHWDCDWEHPVIVALRTLLKNDWDDLQVIHGAQWGQIIPNKTGLVARVKHHRRQVGLRFMVGPPA
jgi:hypothetical protein